MKNKIFLFPLLIVGLMLLTAGTVFGQGRLPTLYVSLDRSEEALLELKSLAESLNLGDEKDLERDYLEELNRQLAMVQKQKALVSDLISHSDSLPENTQVKKLQRFIGLNNEIADIRQWNMGLVNYKAKASLYVLTEETAGRFKNKKSSRKVKRMARMLNRARNSSNIADLNIPMIRRDSVKELNELISNAQDFLVEFEEIVRVRAEEAKRQRIMAAESYFELFCDELKKMLLEDEQGELKALLAILRDFENITDPEDAFSPDGFSTRFNGKVGTNQTFETGKSKLLPDAEKRLQTWLRSQVVPKIERRYKVKGKGPINIDVNVSGYADMQPFRKEHTVAQRKRLNRNLSFKRAKSISDLFESELQILQVEFPYIEWTIESEGKGEDLPPGVDPADKRINNPDRRVCMFSGTIL